MKLDVYIRDHGITQEAFARSINRSKIAVSRYCRRERIPESDTMRAIAWITGGLVTANDFYDLLSSSDDKVNTTIEGA